jgi:hypothetical protein
MLQRRPAAARSLARLQPDQGGLHQAPSPGLPRREPGAAPPAAPQHGIARREQCGDPARRAPARMEHRRVRVQALQQPRRVPAAAVLAAGHQQLRAAAPRLSSRPAPPADPACGRACPAAAATSRTHANMRHKSTRALPASRAGTRGSPAAASRQRPVSRALAPGRAAHVGEQLGRRARDAGHQHGVGVGLAGAQEHGHALAAVPGLPDVAVHAVARAVCAPAPPGPSAVLPRPVWAPSAAPTIDD